MRHLLLVLALAAPLCQAADPLDETLTKLDRAASSFKGMTGNIKQTAHTAVINEDSVESGTIRMKRAKPGDTRMLVDFTQPDAKTVQLQGQKLDIYYPKLKTVQEYDLGKNRTLLEQFLLLGFGTTRNDLAAANDIKYGGTGTFGDRPGVKLELTPKSPDVKKQVQKIDLWLSPDTAYPLGHKVYQQGGDYQQFEFSDIKMNPSLSDSSLKLNLAKNVKKEYPQR
jgi:outer membrane lipoprotein-sorting protein